ncbi:MAG: putative toxin-antitoxin system toxin component, PIN family [Deltaproteobacteria bacterium RBG_16_54_11]|nr:MAG: putative toxin-antitoxin system toxin component, PIN family [Deltaproteobacteria bacterium RBG_16_54_11]
MGARQKAVIRVVLDTNVLVSALLFETTLSRVIDLWQGGAIVPVISKDTFQELQTVLAYPKFSLTPNETRAILEQEILPFFEVIDVSEEVKGICNDPADDKFLACALSASAEYLVSGDKALTDLKQYKSAKIIKPSEFLKLFD